MTDRDRNIAGYTALLGALLDTRRDEATVRFDAELDAALASNRIDDVTARALRWWQRTSVRSVESYLRAVLPGLVALQDDADARAGTEAAEVAASWSRANVLAPGRSGIGAPVRMRLVAQTEAVRAAFVAAEPKHTGRPGQEAGGGERVRPATSA